MENNRKIAISGVIAIAIVASMFAIALNVSAYDHGTTYNANSTFFVQEHSSGAYCQNNTYVQVRVNTSVPCRGVTTDISFDPTCVNITAVDFTNSAWTNGLPAFAHHGNWVQITNSNFFAPYPTGDSLLATITLHCQNATGDCTSALNFTQHKLLNASNKPIPNVAQNGTINCTPVPAPDLNVSKVTLNPGNTRCDEIPRLYVNQSNNISAVIWNNGTADAGQFDVCFDVDGVMVGCVPVAGLAAGANTEVPFQCTPTCANYPVMPGFPPQSLPITINVSADCNCTSCPNCPPDGSCGKVNESDENNTLSMSIPAILPYTGTNGVIAGVVNNGYKSKNFDCNTSEEPLDPYECPSTLECKNIVGGGIEINVSGEKISTFAAQATSTRIHEISLPTNATVKCARLYVYWYDKWGNYKTYPGGCLANLSVNFSGSDLMPEVVYQDSKAFGLYQSPKGSSVFNVTSLMSGSGSYTAIVKNIEPAGGNSTTLLGQMLAVVYEGADHGEEIQLWMLEGTDYLMAADETHNSYNYSVSPDEATATVTFSDGSIVKSQVGSANLITVVAQGMSNGLNLLFNDAKWNNTWNSSSEASPNSKICIENVSVKDYLNASNNSVGFQDTGTNGMQAHNAFLIVKKSQKPIISVDPPLTIVQPQDQFDIHITVNPNGAPVYAVEYYLTYDSTVAWAETQNKGPFLGEYWETWVGQNSIDNPNSVIHYAETRIETEDGVLEPGTLATIQFTAIGERGDWSDLNLTGVIIVNNATKQPYEVIINNGRIEISNNTPPVAVPTLKHRTNNCAKKYPSLTWLCACQSEDEDYPGKGGNITYIRWAFGDGQYGESGWDNCQKEHSYESWRWIPMGSPGGKYYPFEVVLTVRDDGCPEEEGNGYMDVKIYMAGDANGDGRVNILDAVYVGKHWGERCDNDPVPPEPCCWYWTDDRVQQDAADLNNDCVVNILDAVRIGAMWGHTAWGS